MTRFLLTCCLIRIATAWCFAQPKQMELGVFSGINAPYTWDEGINADSRYKARYEIKAAPIGVCYGMDFQGFGFVLTPSLITIGQNFHVINTVGGHEGLRRIDMRYFQVPISLKFHAIDLSFFKVSLVAGAALGYLLDGKETITHEYAKFRFPSEVYPALPPDYSVEYDGVIAPEVNDYEMLGTSDFNSLQWFASGGFRSDWDVSENWRISLDVRGNYGIRDTRSPTYLQQAAAHQKIYDIAGKRREIFASLSISISRYVEIDKERNNKPKARKKFIPQKKPKRGKPKY